MSRKENNFSEKNKPTIIALIAIIIILGLAYISEISKRNGENTNVEEKIVTKVLDGDTVVVEGGEIVRLTGIDADESEQPCHWRAKKRLEELVLGKKVLLMESDEDKDQYGRSLRYLLLDEDNINIMLVEEGLAIARFYSAESKYKDEIVAAEKNAIEEKIGCKWQ